MFPSGEEEARRALDSKALNRPRKRGSSRCRPGPSHHDPQATQTRDAPARPDSCSRFVGPHVPQCATEPRTIALTYRTPQSRDAPRPLREAAPRDATTRGRKRRAPRSRRRRLEGMRDGCAGALRRASGRDDSTRPGAGTLLRDRGATSGKMNSAQPDRTDSLLRAVQRMADELRPGRGARHADRLGPQTTPVRDAPTRADSSIALLGSRLRSRAFPSASSEKRLLRGLSMRSSPTRTSRRPRPRPARERRPSRPWISGRRTCREPPWKSRTLPASRPVRACA